MNTPRLLVLGFAFVAAAGAAFLARGLLGGGTPKVAAAPMPAPIATSQVLVAANDLRPGEALNASDVRWQKWPTAVVDPGFITQAASSNIDAAVHGTVVRSPIVAGEPLTNTEIVHGDAASFMAATLTPGMRAVSITVSIASVAGGFIFPNDRVDLLLTEQVSDTPRRFRTRTVLSDVRVLAIDQVSDSKNQKAVSDAKTATLELTPAEAETIVRAQAAGTLSLSLRALGESNAPAQPVSSATIAAARPPSAAAQSGSEDSEISIIRYGVAHSESAGKGE